MKKKNLRFYIRIYFKILAQDLKSKMSYRADFIISTIGMILTNVSGFIGFWILFRNFPSKSRSPCAESHFMVSKTPITRPILWFSPFFGFPGLPRIMINEPCENGESLYSASMLNLTSYGSREKIFRSFLS